MHITALKTDRVRPDGGPLTSILDHSLAELPDRSVLVITSKIVALCEGRYIRKEIELSEVVIANEADYYLPKSESAYGIPITIRDNAFVARAGIDGSNTDGVYSLLPTDGYATATTIRDYLLERFGVRDVGVIVVDSHSTPLRRGATGVAIGWSGFVGLKGYEDLPDIFGHRFTTHANIVDALAASAALVMGEGAEQTPIAIISDIPFVEFNPASPTTEELAFFKPPLEADLFAPLMSYGKLRKGRRG